MTKPKHQMKSGPTKKMPDTSAAFARKSDPELEKLPVSTAEIDDIRERIQATFPELVRREDNMRRLLFTILSMIQNSVTPPKSAPELYVERIEKRESIVEFLNRVYGPWLNGSFSRADLGKIDPKAYVALINYENKRKRSVPRDILNLPTKWQAKHSREKSDYILAKSL